MADHVPQQAADKGETSMDTSDGNNKDDDGEVVMKMDHSVYGSGTEKGEEPGGDIKGGRGARDKDESNRGKEGEGGDQSGEGLGGGAGEDREEEKTSTKERENADNTEHDAYWQGMATKNVDAAAIHGEEDEGEEEELMRSSEDEEERPHYRCTLWCTPRSQLRLPDRPSWWSTQDTLRYREGYPDKVDIRSLDENYRFYMNEVPYQPRGVKIDQFHKTMQGDYQGLEWNHSYIQWLFPIREQGMNWHAQELQLHEVEEILKDEKAKARLLKSYELMLDFYGIQMVNSNTGKLQRATKFKERFNNLNRSSHNYLRITRILKCLGEFRMEHLKAPFIKFMLREAIITGRLRNVLNSCMCYWVEVLRDEEMREKMWDLAHKMVDKINGRTSRKSGPVAKKGRREGGERESDTVAIISQVRAQGGIHGNQYGSGAEKPGMGAETHETDKEKLGDKTCGMGSGTHGGAAGTRGMWTGNREVGRETHGMGTETHEEGKAKHETGAKNQGVGGGMREMGSETYGGEVGGETHIMKHGAEKATHGMGTEAEKETDGTGTEAEKEADGMGTEAEKEADGTGTEAEKEADGTGTEAEKEADGTGTEAEKEADGTGTEAEKEADGTGTEAEKEADGTGTEAEKEADGTGTEAEKEADGTGTEAEKEADGTGTEAEKEADGTGTEAEKETDGTGTEAGKKQRERGQEQGKQHVD